ncbi:MAG: hypothetical protein R3175_11565 [Marinobacter sp.]|uniref:hypothetical protein n=1 Tax=Marinobacter sp. TaxID=50741 RepID=UPI00299E50F0|nr:hypothetical protein [Marinobacter sp.]MDX1756689.1 hypothetical protein [Marinobacter sp.]
MRAFLFHEEYNLSIESGIGFMNRSLQNQHSILVSLCLMVLLVLGWTAFSPGLSGPFMLDDFDNLGALEVGVTDIRSFEEYMSMGNAGPLDRPISKLSFLLNDNAWPSDPESFKRTNLLIHLLVGVLVFIAARQVSRIFRKSDSADWIAIVCTGIWLLHPIQVSTVLYPVQRMAQLSALFVLAGVCFYFYMRCRVKEWNFRRLSILSVGLGVFGLLAVFSKENGALLPMFIAVAELTIFSKFDSDRLFAWWRRLCIWLPSLIILAYLLYIPRWMGGYTYREFTLVERIITEPVILWDYLFSMFSLQVHGLGLFQDDYPIYSSLLSPAAGAAALLTALALVGALLLRKKYPVLCFGVLWYFSGHLVESTTVALELYFEHRNYVSMFGVTLAFAYFAKAGFEKLSTEFARFYGVFLPALIMIVGAITYGYSTEWGDENRILTIWATEHPYSPRAQRTYAQHLANMGYPEAALDSLDVSHDSFPHDLSIPIMSMGISCAFNREQRYEPEALLEQFDAYQWTDGLRPAASHLSEMMWPTGCEHLAEGVASLLGNAVRFEGARVSGIAALLVIAGDIRKRAGDGDGALSLYLKVDDLKPSVDSATRIAGLFLGAGNYPEARRALEVAIERDSVSGISESKMEEYKRIFALIDGKMSENPQ